jgi:hypothetical protein
MISRVFTWILGGTGVSIMTKSKHQRNWQTPSQWERGSGGDQGFFTLAYTLITNMTLEDED